MSTMAAGHRPLFENQPLESPRTKVEAHGDVPPWLRGALVRVGPGLFETPGKQCTHWFEGLAYMVRFELGSECFFTARHLRSRSYERAMRPPAFPRLQPWLTRASALLGLRGPSDNASVNIAPFADGMMAMTETVNRVRFDPFSLETLGPALFLDELPGHLTTAHPVRDEQRRCLFNYRTEFGKETKYHLFALDDGSRARRPVATLTANRPAYMHSFGATENHLLIAEFPLFIQPLQLRFGSKFLVDYMKWQPEAGTRIRAVHKDSGEVHGEWTVDPFYGFHHVAARETERGLEMDIVAFDDPAILFELTLERLRTSPPAGMGRLRRFWLGQDGQWSSRDLSGKGLELPRIDRRRATSELRYVYGISDAGKGGFTDQITKIDAARAEARTWHQEGLFPGEPVFVPRPEGHEEDDGVVLTVAYDADRDRSALVILDAQGLSERARIEAPLRIPQGFHGELVEDAAG
jgi:carotenoid cleavage dioxygenase-like enzyme